MPVTLCVYMNKTVLSFTKISGFKQNIPEKLRILKLVALALNSPTAFSSYILEMRTHNYQDSDFEPKDYQQRVQRLHLYETNVEIFNQPNKLHI